MVNRYSSLALFFFLLTGVFAANTPFGMLRISNDQNQFSDDILLFDCEEEEEKETKVSTIIHALFGDCSAKCVIFLPETYIEIVDATQNWVVFHEIDSSRAPPIYAS